MSNNASEANLTDLEIRILERGECGYPVEMTLGGQQEFRRGYLDASILPFTPTNDPSANGKSLFDKLFADPILCEAWCQCCGQAPARRIRLRIDPAAAELHPIPWELLQQDSIMLAACVDTPFSRYLPIALPWAGAVTERPIRVLVVISNPDDLESAYELAPVEVEVERKTLTAALGGVQQVQVDFLPPPITLERIEDACRRGYHIWHFVGHGVYNAKEQRAALLIQDEQGHCKRAADDALVGVLARQGIQPRLVFLSACQSATRSSADAFRGLGPKLVSAGVPAVVAMQDAITIASAQKFAKTFYTRLLEHGQVDEAMNEARSTLLTSGRLDAAVPVLFMRLRSGQLWSAEADARGKTLGQPQPRVFWSTLVDMIEDGQCTPIIGPRVHGRWLPTNSEIALEWSKKYEYPFADHSNSAAVTRYLAIDRGKGFMLPRYLDKLMTEFTRRVPESLRPIQKCATLTELVSKVGYQNLPADDPNDVHRLIAQFNLPLYLTTNCDSLMVEALKAQGRKPARETCNWIQDKKAPPSLFSKDGMSGYVPTAEAPLVYHLFGDDTKPESLVLTEDDYLNFLVQISANREVIPDWITGTMSGSALMFLGYDLNDWEFRVIMRGLVAMLNPKFEIRHVAVQLDLGNMDEQRTLAVQSYLQKYFQQSMIDVYWGNLPQFVAELREAWETRNR